MSEQLWNFAGIEGGSSEIMGAVGTTSSLLQEGKQSLTVLQSIWTGISQDAYTQVQMRWDNTSNELNSALQNLAHTISEAGQTMGQTESGVAGMFSG
jgi:early secretory antigenic target protein ESAT-6